MNFNLTFTLPEFSSPLQALWWILIHGGFVPLVIVFLFGAWWLYLEIIRERFEAKQQYILLAIDVPRENEQTPKAVEHIFSHLHGIQRGGTWKQKYIEGYVQASISIELISIGGFIQFLIRCLASHRDMVEAAIYAQYPTAEITEVEDYTHDFVAQFPNDEYNMWGAEIVPYAKDYLPIRTYPQWEHMATQTFLDPMASLLEVMGRIQEGENIWLQWVLEPAPNDTWRKHGIEAINKIAGIKTHKKVSLAEELAQVPENLIVGTWQTLSSSLLGLEESSPKKKEDKENVSILPHLPPNVMDIVKSIGIKISKLGFETKFRFCYVARNDVFNLARVGGVFGALKQYSSMDMNGFRPDKSLKTARDFFFVKRRVAALQRKIMLGYQHRSMKGRAPFVLNTEELATIWHFPVLTVKAPSVKKSDAKRGEPPTSLPLGDDTEYVPRPRPAAVPPVQPIVGAEPDSSSAGGPPANLPIG